MTSEGDVWGVVADENAGKSSLAFRVLRAGKHLQTVRLEPEITYIGRMPENHVVLDDPKVSRSHARIVVSNDKCFLEDQESENGTFVNGQKVGRQTIALGDRIEMGSHVLEVVEASTPDREAVRESHLDQAENEEWRMDQTISLSSEQLRQKVMEASAKRKMKTEPTHKEAPTPEMEFSLKVGGSTLKKQFQFKNVRARKETDPAGNELEIRLRVGKWILEQRIPLK